MRSGHLVVAVAAALCTQALAATPPHGVPLQIRRGFFTETDIGAFFTVGGDDAYSNAQSYLQLGVGVDAVDRLSLSAHVAFGANAFNCFAGRVGDLCAQSDAFAMTFLGASIAYMVPLADRLSLMPRLVVGWTFLDPAPVSNVTQGLNAGAGIGVEYATSMDHFAVGLDVVGRYVFRANIPTFSIFPRVKYTF